MLEFIVDGQLLRRKDGGRIVSDSAEFLKFRSSFSKEWEGYTKTFLFKGGGGESYCVFAVEEGKEYCVPHEVLKGDSRVEVSVFGSSRLTNFATANSVMLYVEKNALLGDYKQSVVPSPDLFAQICHKLEQTLRLLPGKNLELKNDGESIYWKTGEDSSWQLLFSLRLIRGKDGAFWYSGGEIPLNSLGKNGDFFFWEKKGSILQKENGAWRTVFAPEDHLLPLVQRGEEAAHRAEEAEREALRCAQKSQESASRTEELMLPPSLYPDAFEVWNWVGAMKLLAVGQPIEGDVMEPEQTYRVPVEPGKTYRFTAFPSSQGDRFYFAVGDGQGICLDYKEQSASEYTVKKDYNGKIPTHIYYAVKDAAQGEISFYEVVAAPIHRRLGELEEANMLTANALKASAAGKTLILSQVSPVPHAIRLSLQGENPQEKRVLLTGKNLLDPSLLEKVGAVRQADGTLYFASCSESHAVLYRGDGASGRMTLSYEVKTANAEGYSGQRFRIFYRNDPQAYSVGAVCSKDSFREVEIQTAKGKEVDRIELDYGSVENSTWFSHLQLEFGEKKTAYEPYCGAEFCPEADGSVAGAMAIHPQSIIRSADGETVMQAQYHRDLNAAYAELEARLAALEGALV